MKHYRCLTSCVSKTRRIITAETFRLSETNIFILPKITIEEQIANVALSLSQAMRNNYTFCFPNTELMENTHTLASVFQQGVDKT